MARAHLAVGMTGRVLRLPLAGGPDAPGSAGLRRAPERVLVVHLPAFRLERLGHAAHDLAALTTEQRGATRLVSITPGAREAGLREGMTAAEARARLPGLALEPLDVEAEWEDRLALVERFRRLTDRVAPLWEADVGLEVAATAHLFGGEPGVLQAARELAESFGHHCRLAIADDPLAAGALATWGPADPIAPPGGAAPLLAPLPILALRPSPALIQALDTLGIRDVGAWARLDAASVAGRFGEEGARLHRVARGMVASGGLPAVAEVAPIRVEVVLGGATSTLAPVMFALTGLLARLSRLLERRGALAVRLGVHLGLERGVARVLRFRVGRPTRAPDVLERLLRARLEALTLDAPIVSLSLEVEEQAPDGGVQPGLTDRVESAEHPEDLFARLIDALGEDALVTPDLVDTWRPERAWRPRRRGARPPESPEPPPRIDPVEVLWRWERDLPRPRPTLLLPRPQPIDVRVDSTSPHAFDAERPLAIHLDRGWEPIHRALGPERLEGEWWSDDGGFARDYWVVETPRGTGWIFHEGARWFLHGWFD